MSAKDEQYMHEINRLEGERDYLRAKVDELRAELQTRMAWRLTKSLDERTRERDEAREAARWHRRALLSDADIRLHRYELGAQEWPWIASEPGDGSVREDCHAT